MTRHGVQPRYPIPSHQRRALDCKLGFSLTHGEPNLTGILQSNSQECCLQRRVLFLVWRGERPFEFHDRRIVPSIVSAHQQDYVHHAIPPTKRVEAREDNRKPRDEHDQQRYGKRFVAQLSRRAYRGDQVDGGPSAVHVREVNSSIVHRSTSRASFASGPWCAMMRSSTSHWGPPNQTAPQFD